MSLSETFLKGLSISCVDCGWRIRQSRGICNACYRKQWGMIQEGKITEEELIAQGKRLEVQSNHSKKPPLYKGK